MELLTTTSPAVIALAKKIEVIFNEGALQAGAYGVDITEGPRYLRVARVNRAHNVGLTRSVYLFIDRQNGDLLKASGWSAPAKGARGNLHQPDALRTATPYGFGYRR